MGGTWVQREGIISALVPPERLAPLLATSPAQLESELVGEIVDAFGESARDPQAVFLRRWGVDPFTLGYITSWRPGDVMAVGPLHATPRAAVLRLRLRPVGLRLHGGRGPDRPRRRVGRARRLLSRVVVVDSDVAVGAQHPQRVGRDLRPRPACPDQARLPGRCW